ncbi:kinase-associated lipoprotein B [Paenibacillus mucilaginosus]|uniref:Kinase-associated protein B n=1 Tax=Paenibacillus mucilaginosus (strain KNP414) TaxID=1036673 RepID=F8F5V8_PAEMK|nr:kinase-associated lipoprotein B [Paenibacillus mucilaginosus]AEI41522.1 kinase-associated protein B [Paenibacillus mucilaginosus KNP414]MCG7215438.1 kinase-associated lipoprotein B [Paenibacillus mucilaginosus]WDM30530.1 kinase-associated lipoprotein B [Paenibacillus mucilaginosus]
MEQFDVTTAGALVRASYKTGEYIGETVEVSPSGKIAVKILAVVKHPTQGDLHNPMEADVAFFHQRRALAFQEIALMPSHTVKPYTGTVPEYRTSLLAALEAQRQELQGTVRWAKRCLEELEALAREY